MGWYEQQASKIAEWLLHLSFHERNKIAQHISYTHLHAGMLTGW